LFPIVVVPNMTYAGFFKYISCIDFSFFAINFFVAYFAMFIFVYSLFFAYSSLCSYSTYISKSPLHGLAGNTISLNLSLCAIIEFVQHLFLAFNEIYTLILIALCSVLFGILAYKS
jgi:hypothetical protein